MRPDREAPREAQRFADQTARAKHRFADVSPGDQRE
jgi:hypothetical protein